MEKLNEFMEKVKADEALQKEFAQIIGEGGAELTKEQKEKIVELAAKSGIELDVEGELSEEALGSIVGGMDEEPLVWVSRSHHRPSPLEFKWTCTYMDTYRCKNCGKTIMVSLGESPSLGWENDCPAGDFLGHHEYEKVEAGGYGNE